MIEGEDRVVKIVGGAWIYTRVTGGERWEFWVGKSRTTKALRQERVTALLLDTFSCAKVTARNL